MPAPEYTAYCGLTSCDCLPFLERGTGYPLRGYVVHSLRHNLVMLARNEKHAREQYMELFPRARIQSVVRQSPAVDRTQTARIRPAQAAFYRDSLARSYREEP